MTRHRIQPEQGFSIRFIGQAVTIGEIEDDDVVEGEEIEEQRPAQVAEVRIGSFRDQYWCPTDRWSVQEYLAQWRGAIARLRAGGDRDIFLLAVHPAHGPGLEHAIMAWRVGDELRFQEKYIDLHAIDPSDPASLLMAIGPYSKHTEDGDLISDDWPIPAIAMETAVAE